MLRFFRPPAFAGFLCCLAQPARLAAQTESAEPPARAPSDAAAPSDAVAPSDAAKPSDAAAPGDAVEPTPAEQDPLDVTVVGTRLARTPGSAHVITERQLERFEYDDAQVILQQVPGVYVRQEDGIGLRPNIGIRGANPDRSKKLTLMEDGVLFGPAPYSAPAAYYFPLMTRMTYVRVVKGPSAIAYGPQTVGGAIDFVSRPIPEDTRAAVDVAFGEYGYGKVHAYAGASDGQKGFLVEGVRLWNTGFKELPNGGDTGSTRNDWMVKANYVLDPLARDRNEFQLKLAYSDEVSNESYLGLTDEDFREDPYQRYPASALDQMENHRTSLVFSHRFDRRGMKIKTDVYRHDYERSWRKFNRLEGSDAGSVLRNPDDPRNQDFYQVLKGADASADPETGTGTDLIWIGPNHRTFVSQGIQSVLSLDFDHGPISQRLELGTRIHYDQIDRRHTENAYVMSGGQLVPAKRETKVNAAELESSTAFAMHVQDAVTFRDLTVTPGVRIELIRWTADDYLGDKQSSGLVRALMPGAGAFYGITPEFGVLAGVYRGFSPPPPASADGTQPEYSVNYEGGARLSDGPLRAELIGFYNDYSNMTDICDFASGCTSENVDQQFDAGQAHVYGLEAYAAHTLPLPADLSLPFTVAYTFTRGVFDSNSDSEVPGYGVVVAGDEIPYIPRHQLNVTLGVEHPRAGIAAAATYVSAMREEASSEPIDEALATDEQFILDLGGHFKVAGPLSIYANLRNALDGVFIVSRRPFGARPNAPRWFQLGLKLEI